MTTLFAVMLVIHVLTGVVAIGMHNVVLMHLIKRAPNFVFISRVAWGSVALFFISWGTSAYYYVLHYGGAVKPRILAGGMPSAHSFFMETKEHVFLILPLIAISIALCTSYLRRVPDETLKHATTFLTLLALSIGGFATISGIFISGSI